ncbi:MAG: hypothetical protein ACNA8W_13685 [Bradymonadaceae bacterium]
MDRALYIIVAATLLILGVPAAGLAETQDENPLQCETCTRDCEARGLEVGERVCTGPDGSVNAPNLQRVQATPQDEPKVEPRPRPGIDDIQVSAVQWTFLPIIETVETEGYVSPVQAQNFLQGQAAQMVDCFNPRDYRAAGHVMVDLYLTYIGAPQGVRGMTQGIAPRQARCILAQAWGYNFPTTPDAEEARVRYRVSFLADRQAAMTLDPQRPQLLVERVQVEEENVPEQELAGELATRAFDARQCHAIALQELPNDLIVADVEMDFQRRTGIYQATNIDITVINETSTTMPSPELVECVRLALSTWYAEIPKAEPDRFKSKFFLTFRPPGPEL